MAKQTPLLLNPTRIFAFLWQEERRSGGLILVSALLALLLANSPWSGQYFNFLAQVPHFGGLHLSLRLWINEGLMTVFFLLVGLEIKRELTYGELRAWQKAAFPLIAAIGGMLGPALIYALFNPYPPRNAGWGIPMATDIALAVGALGLLGNRVHKNIRIFLLALAIVDDIGSVLIIGLFYNRPANTIIFIMALLLSISLFAVRRRSYWPLACVFIGAGIWYCLVSSGLSGTLAGIIIAFAVPSSKKRRKLNDLQSNELIEDKLAPLASYLIVPLFAFANAGIRFKDVILSSRSPVLVMSGVMLGLLIGKPLGIFCAAWLSTVLRIAQKPRGINWKQLAGAVWLAGIGFTISLLITDRAFADNFQLHNAATIGIFAGSILSGAAGLIVLNNSLAKR